MSLIARTGRIRDFRVQLALLQIVGLMSWIASAPVAAQPNPGIDPCNRAIAALATPVAAGTPDPSSVRLAVSQTVMNFASCFNRRNWDGVLALTDAGFRESMFGVADSRAFRSRLESLDQRGLLANLLIDAIEENGTTGSALATLVVSWHGWSDVHRELWRVQQENSSWRLTGRSIQIPHLNGTAVGIRFRIGGEGLTAPLTQITNPGIVVLSFENTLDEDVTALVLAVAPGQSAESVAGECNDLGAERFDPVGQIQAPVGETVTMPLQQLTPGRFAIIAGVDPCGGDIPVSVESIEILDISALVEA